MPFTPAHAVIVLPFLRLKPERVSATALVIGSLSPDFEYFFKMSVSSTHSHTLLGILYFDIPTTILLSFLFHKVIKLNLINNLPGFIQQRLSVLKSFHFAGSFKKHVVVFILSAGVGALSHIFWDAFTHNGGYFAQNISLYKKVYIPFDGVRYPLFYALQHISTIVGLSIIILYFLFIRPDKTIPVRKVSYKYWLAVLLITATILLLRFGFNLSNVDLGNFVVSTISAFLLGLVICGFIKFKSQAIP